jgi:uncharacterized protein YwbE
MNRRLLVAGLVMLAAASIRADLLACGDKFFLPGRGVSFDEAYKARHPGSVLIYAPPGSQGAVTGVATLRAMLTRVGHRVTVVQDADQLTSALGAGNVDLVLTDFSSVGALGIPAAPTTTSPAILPVMHNPTKAVTASCKLQYACQLKTTDGIEKFVSTINSFLDNRAKAKALKGARGN